MLCTRVIVFMLCTRDRVHVAYAWSCSCCVRVIVFMLRTRACVHVAYACLCSCCVRVLVFMLRTRACVHVAYACLCSCCVRVFVFMLCTCACVHVPEVGTRQGWWSRVRNSSRIGNGSLATVDMCSSKFRLESALYSTGLVQSFLDNIPRVFPENYPILPECMGINHHHCPNNSESYYPWDTVPTEM